MQGESTTARPEVSTLDEVLGHKDGSTSRQAIADLAAQLAARPELTALNDELEARVAAAEGDIETLDSATDFASILKGTWTDLSALSGTGDGQRAEVADSDAGTHSAASETGYDGATVDNAGSYSWNSTWSRWVRIGSTGLTGLQDQIDTKASVASVGTSFYAPTPNKVLSPGNNGTDGWIVSAGTLTQTAASDGRPTLTLAHTTGATAIYDVVVPAGATNINYSFSIEAKDATTSARVNIIQYDAEGTGTSGGSSVENDQFSIPNAANANRVDYSGTIAVGASVERLIVFVDKGSGDTELEYSEVMIAFDSVATYREPEDNRAKKEVTRHGYPMQAGYMRSATTGAASSSFKAAPADGDGLRVVATGSGLRWLPSQLSDYDGGAYQIEIKTTLDDVSQSGTSGAIITLGDVGSDFRAYAYLENGFVGVLDQNDSVVEGSVLAPTTDDDEALILRLNLWGDGTGELVAEGPDGTTGSLALDSVATSGPIGIGWRDGSTGTVHYIRAIPLPAEFGSVKSSAGANTSLAARGSRILPTPDSLSGRDPAGWTCTGADQYDAGPLYGYIAGDDDGRLVEGDGSPYNAAVHFVTPNFGRVGKTLTLPSPTLASAQGIAIDRGPYIGTFWVARPSPDNTIRNYDNPTGDMDGSASAAVENSGRAISFTGANGLAYDTDHGGALWASTATTAAAKQLDVTDGTVLDTKTLGANPDQLQFLSALDMADGEARLVYTTGSNGSAGSVRVYNLATDEDAAWATLTGVNAIEQFWYDPKTGVGWALSDEGYHGDVENQVFFFTMPPLPV